APLVDALAGGELVLHVGDLRQRGRQPLAHRDVGGGRGDAHRQTPRLLIKVSSIESAVLITLAAAEYACCHFTRSTISSSTETPFVLSLDLVALSRALLVAVLVASAPEASAPSRPPT